MTKLEYFRNFLDRQERTEALDEVIDYFYDLFCWEIMVMDEEKEDD